MYFDFVEIGTSDFEVGENNIIDHSKQYLFVEPLKFYLEKLPTGPNITKANCAITDKETTLEMFFIEEENILKYNLPLWVKGCNKLGSEHPTVKKLIKENNLPQHIITRLSIECLTFKTLIQKYNISKIDKLKIDTEGHDHVILKDVIKLLIDNEITINSITFEYIQVFENTFELDRLSKFLAGVYPRFNKRCDDVTYSI